MELIRCPLCNSPNAKKVKTADYGMKVRIVCPKCGHFQIMDFKVNGHNYKNHSSIDRLMYHINNTSSESNYIELHYDKLEEIISNVIYPETIEEKVDLLLQFIIDNEEDLNNGCAISSNNLGEFALRNGNELEGLISFAVENEMISTDIRLYDGRALCKLRNKGRLRIKELDQIFRDSKNKVILLHKNPNFTVTMQKAFESAENEINNGNPDHAHDRMHTFLHDYFKQLCLKLSLYPKNQKPDILELFSLIQKELNNKYPNDITVKIFRALSKALVEINDIRNTKSLTHPNPVLEKTDAMFVINTIKTIYVYLEEKVK